MKPIKNTKIKKLCSLLLAAALFLTGLAVCPARSAEAAPSCKTLAKAVLKSTGGTSYLKYTSKSAKDFGALGKSARKKVKSIMYLFDDKEVYSVCVIKAKKTSGAKSLLKTLKKYKKNNCSNNYYMSDYSSTEQAVLKNAIYGRKGKYVWYIAMSGDKSTNTSGQKALKKKL